MRLKAPALLVLAAFVPAFLAGCGDQGAPSSPTTSAADAPRAAAVALTYPAARTVEQQDDYHGTRVADPYRWMEDLDSPELKTWIDAENAVTEQYLSDAPGRAQIKQRLGELWNYERYGTTSYGLIPTKRGDRYFYSRNDGLKDQFEIFVQDGLTGEPRLLLDPNKLSADGTVALSEIGISDDGKRFAYSLSDGGSDWRTIKVRDVDTGEDLPDTIQWAKFTSIEWAKDGSGFWYSRYDAPTGENELKAVNKFQKVYYHRMGTAQDADTLVYERKDQPDWGFGAEVSDDGKYLVITVWQGTDERNLIFYKDLSKPDSKVVELIRDWTATYDYIGNDGATFFVRTDDGAERARIMAIDTANAARDQWSERVAENEATLTDVELVNHEFIAHYLKDAHSQVQVYSLTGGPVREVALPGLGTVTGFAGSADATETFFSFAGFTTPTTLYRYDATDGTVSEFRKPMLAFDPSLFETTQVFYTTKDGTRIPMFIVSRKGLAKNGDTPTILYGYGGFNIPVTPSFSASVIAWMEAGGIYAVANLRGGGEYGRAWHEAGMKLVKQNVFDDFAAAAEYLIAEKYTRPDKLAISGRSNGGLLAAATALQRPELFGASLPAVGVLDMLRFREFTIGWAWESDYGSVKNADEFAALYKYSPLHNIKTGVEYPPMLITTADRDDRVFPAHSFKFAAALQAAYKGKRPMLIRIETRAGHGAGKPTTKIIEETADLYAFLFKTLNMTVPAATPATPAGT